jgi:uncharacterized protein (DUF885 family)
MKRIIALTLLAALAVATSGNAAIAPKEKKSVSSTSEADQALDAFLAKYVIEFLRRNPAVNTYLGGAGLDPSLREVDGKLREFTPQGLQYEDIWLRWADQELRKFDPAKLSPSHHIDRDVALAQVRFQLFLHQSRHYTERCLDTYTDEPFRAVDFQLQGMTPTGPGTYGTVEEWDLLIARVGQVPNYMRNARQQLKNGIATKNTPDFRMLFRNGIKTAEADAHYFDTTLPEIAHARVAPGPEHDRIIFELARASNVAAGQYRTLRNYVAEQFFDDPTKESGVKKIFAGDRFAMGESAYNWSLRNNLRVESSAAKLYDDSWPIVESTQREMVTLAREIGKKHEWTLPEDGNAAVRQVFDELGKDYPKTDAEMVSWYRDAAFRLVEYSRKTGLFDVPADYKLDVIETPAPLRASIDGAAYYPAPPFRNTGVGRFYVTPTDNDVAQLKENNRSALADLSAHEGFPGHDWYYKVLTQRRADVSPVRWLTPGAVEDSSSMWEDSMSAEGWGLYAEALMAEPRPNAPHGFYTPEERLYQLQGKLYRDLRVRIDTGIHTGKLTYNQAVDLFSQVVNFLPGSCSDAAALKNEAKRASCDSADKAIFRYSKWPTQAITYRLGKDEIYALRAAAQKKAGSKFDLKRFHLLFIEQGTIPPGYFREELLKKF